LVTAFKVPSDLDETEKDTKKENREGRRRRRSDVVRHRVNMIKQQLVLSLSIALFSAAAQTPRITVLHTPENGIQPQAAVDSKGVVHLIYFKGEPRAGNIFYVHREPGKNEFSKPIQVNTQPHTAMAMGTIRGAQLAVGKNGRVHVVWDGMGEGTFRPAHGASDIKQPLFYTRINDAGTAFESERNVITYAYGLDGGSSVAADLDGNVHVTWHASQPGNTNGEAGRAIFVARSTNEGKTFQREAPAISKPTGACACCAMRAFADSHGNIFAFYRAAYQMTNRDETLLISRNRGADFEIAYSHRWNIGTCPMSSASISETSGEILVAAETHGRVFFIRLDPKPGRVSSPVSPDTQAKHPVAVGNARGEVLLAWSEGTGWNKSGSVAWQVYDRESRPISAKGRADGLPTWSLPTAFVEPDGKFTIVY